MPYRGTSVSNFVIQFFILYKNINLRFVRKLNEHCWLLNIKIKICHKVYKYWLYIMKYTLTLKTTELHLK